jgi:hypothetical protein
LLKFCINFFIYFGVQREKTKFSSYKVYFLLRNSAVETVEQELLFVGSETGKLLAVRELVKKVYWTTFLNCDKIHQDYITGGRLSTVIIIILHRI